MEEQMSCYDAHGGSCSPPSSPCSRRVYLYSAHFTGRFALARCDESDGDFDPEDMVPTDVQTMAARIADVTMQTAPSLDHIVAAQVAIAAANASSSSHSHRHSEGEGEVIGFSHSSSSSDDIGTDRKTQSLDTSISNTSEMNVDVDVDGYAALQTVQLDQPLVDSDHAPGIAAASNTLSECALPYLGSETNSESLIQQQQQQPDERAATPSAQSPTTHRYAPIVSPLRLSVSRQNSLQLSPILALGDSAVLSLSPHAADLAIEHTSLVTTLPTLPEVHGQPQNGGQELQSSGDHDTLSLHAQQPDQSRARHNGHVILQDHVCMKKRHLGDLPVASVVVASNATLEHSQDAGQQQPRACEHEHTQSCEYSSGGQAFAPDCGLQAHISVCRSSSGSLTTTKGLVVSSSSCLTSALTMASAADKQPHARDTKESAQTAKSELTVAASADPEQLVYALGTANAHQNIDDRRASEHTRKSQVCLAAQSFARAQSEDAGEDEDSTGDQASAQEKVDFLARVSPATADVWQHEPHSLEAKQQTQQALPANSAVAAEGAKKRRIAPFLVSTELTTQPTGNLVAQQNQQLMSSAGISALLLSSHTEAEAAATVPQLDPVSARSQLQAAFVSCGSAGSDTSTGRVLSNARRHRRALASLDYSADQPPCAVDLQFIAGDTFWFRRLASCKLTSSNAQRVERMTARVRKGDGKGMHERDAGAMDANSASARLWRNMQRVQAWHWQHVATVDAIAYGDLGSHTDDSILGVTAAAEATAAASAKDYNVANDEDEVMPIYGDSESEGEYPDDLLREMDAERRDVDKHRARAENIERQRVELVRSIIQERKTQFESDWQTRVRPKLEALAYKNWRQHIGRRARLEGELARLSIQRLPNEEKGVFESGCSSRRELVTLCEGFHLTINQIAETKWMLQLIGLPCPRHPIRKQRCSSLSSSAVPNQAQRYSALLKGRSQLPETKGVDSDSDSDSSNDSSNISSSSDSDSMAGFIDDEDDVRVGSNPIINAHGRRIGSDMADGPNNVARSQGRSSQKLAQQPASRAAAGSSASADAGASVVLPVQQRLRQQLHGRPLSLEEAAAAEEAALAAEEALLTKTKGKELAKYREAVSRRYSRNRGPTTRSQRSRVGLDLGPNQGESKAQAHDNASVAVGKDTDEKGKAARQSAQQPTGSPVVTTTVAMSNEQFVRELCQHNTDEIHDAAMFFVMRMMRGLESLADLGAGRLNPDYPERMPAVSMRIALRMWSEFMQWINVPGDPIPDNRAMPNTKTDSRSANDTGDASLVVVTYPNSKQRDEHLTIIRSELERTPHLSVTDEQQRHDLQRMCHDTSLVARSLIECPLPVWGVDHARLKSANANNTRDAVFASFKRVKRTNGRSGGDNSDGRSILLIRRWCLPKLARLVQEIKAIRRAVFAAFFHWRRTCRVETEGAEKQPTSSLVVDSYGTARSCDHEGGGVGQLDGISAVEDAAGVDADADGNAQSVREDGELSDNGSQLDSKIAANRKRRRREMPVHTESQEVLEMRQREKQAVVDFKRRAKEQEADIARKRMRSESTHNAAAVVHASAGLGAADEDEVLASGINFVRPPAQSLLSPLAQLASLKPSALPMMAHTLTPLPQVVPELDVSTIGTPVHINLGHEADQRNVFVPGFIGSHLKEHQVEGVQFMWQNVVALSDHNSAASDSENGGSKSKRASHMPKQHGCVLAHSMGLGKTLQTVAFVYTLLNEILEGSADFAHSTFGTRRVLVLCPPTVQSNWAAEFEKWTGVGHTRLSLSKPSGPILPTPYDATSDSDQQQRILHAVRVRARRVITQVVSFEVMTNSKMQMVALKSWHAHGGVLIMGYPIFRRLVQRATAATVAGSDKPADTDGRLPDSARPMSGSALVTGTNGLAAPTSPNGTRQQQQDLLRKYLIDEGPCLVIADEGHCIKNPETQLAKAANMLKTRARICLTGYPLQNRIEEYWTMVDFCYPQFLGDLADFRYRYIKPINDGMYVDATKDDKRRSKLHMGMLQKLLETMVDRRDSGLLYHELPRKVEYFISCPLTPMQSQLYIEYLARFVGIGLGAREGTNIGLLQHGHLLLTICNHPAVFKASVEENRCRRQQQQQRQRQQIQQQADLSAIIDDVVDISAIDEEGKCDGDELTGRIADDDAWCREIYERHCGSSQPGIDIADDIADDIDNSGVQNPEHSTKVRMALHIIRESIACGERVLVFSRSIPTLDYLQWAIEHAGIADCDGQKQKGRIQSTRNRMMRIDGATPVTHRQSLIDGFNADDSLYRVFLISSGTGSIGINLVSASR
ncbi:hypothetical protein LPJ66_003100, partial [Kickxella alabastrina]